MQSFKTIEFVKDPKFWTFSGIKKIWDDSSHKKKVKNR